MEQQGGEESAALDFFSELFQDLAQSSSKSLLGQKGEKMLCFHSWNGDVFGRGNYDVLLTRLSKLHKQC